MKFSGPYGLAFEIPDEWWAAAGAAGFVPARLAYRVPDRVQALAVPLIEIEPPRRAPGILGLHRGQLVSVLRAMVADEPLPPVPVEILRPEPPHYMPRDGFHRYHAAVALGFTHLSAVEVQTL